MTAKARQWVINKVRELILWAVFVVLAGVYPIWVVYNRQRLVSRYPVNLTELIIQGELLLVAFGIAADSTSRVVSRVFQPRKGTRIGNWQLIGIVASILFLVMAGSEYSTVISIGQAMVHPEYIASQSEILFVAALLTGGGLVLLD